MSDVEEMKAKLKLYEEARAKGIPASTINGCPCDFCTGKKKHEDNWCSYCANVQMQPPKSWLNLDMCDDCEKTWREQCQSTASET